MLTTKQIKLIIDALVVEYEDYVDAWGEHQLPYSIGEEYELDDDFGATIYATFDYRSSIYPSVHISDIYTWDGEGGALDTATADEIETIEKAVYYEINNYTEYPIWLRDLLAQRPNTTSTIHA